MSAIPIPTSFPAKYYSHTQGKLVFFEPPQGPMKDGMYWFTYLHDDSSWESGFYMPSPEISKEMWDRYVYIECLVPLK